MAVSVSDVNEGPIVNIAAWFGMVFMISAVLTRVGSKYIVVRKGSMDDFFIVLTMLLGCAITITVSLMVANGLGRPQSTLTDDQIMAFQKCGYATQLLYIPTLYLAKLSVLLYIRALSPQPRFVLLNSLLEVFITLWGLSAEFAIAFQCRFPSPWAIISGKCFDTVAFWIANSVFDILTDLAISLVPVYYLVWPRIKLSWTQKCGIGIMFGSRILIIPLTVWRVYYLFTSSSPSAADQTLSLWHAYLATTIQLNFAVFMACVPFLKPFMETMSSGGMASTIPPSSSYGKGSRVSTVLSSLSTRKASKLKMRYTSDNISESSLNGTRQNPGSSGTSEININPSQAHQPSFDDDIHFVIPTANDMGPLRLDNVMHISQVSHVSLPENNLRNSVGSGDMTIVRTKEWDVQKGYKGAEGKNRGSTQGRHELGNGA